MQLFFLLNSVVAGREVPQVQTDELGGKAPLEYINKAKRGREIISRQIAITEAIS